MRNQEFFNWSSDSSDGLGQPTVLFFRGVKIPTHQDKRGQNIFMMIEKKVRKYTPWLLIILMLGLACNDSAKHPVTPPDDILHPFLPHEGSWVTITSPTEKDLQNVTFLNKQVGYATSYGNIFKSDDGGENWRILLTRDVRPYLGELFFLNDHE